MKKRFVFIILLLIIAIGIFNSFESNNDAKDFKPLEIEVGKPFNYLNYGSEVFVLNYEIFDINADNEQDIILVIGEKAEAQDCYKNIDIVVYNKLTETFIVGKLKNFQGSQPKIYLNDVDGDELKDIIIITNLENMSNDMRIISLKDGEAKEIFKEKNMNCLDVTGEILDGFKAKLSIKKMNKNYEIDLTENKQNYITSGFYEENGKLKTDKTKIASAGVYNIEFVKIDDRYGIKYTERIKGFDNLDIIEQINVIIKYEKGTWSLVEVSGEKIGKIS